MSKAMTAASKEQLVELMQYLSQNISVPTIGIGGGFAPIGTIISYMGTTAPQDYLICDGTTYNIADYKQLSDFFAAQFGSANFFGGDGVTTFKVPDLRGEFLRGTGTNSHTNQGSGANVGTHQDGTEHVAVRNYGNAYNVMYMNTITPTEWGAGPKNVDFSKDSLGYVQNPQAWTVVEDVDNKYGPYTSRPTNTSVLYCIKAVAAGDVYSTSERVVGTWIDGKPVYEKTLTGLKFSSSIQTDGGPDIYKLYQLTDLGLINIDTVVSVYSTETLAWNRKTDDVLYNYFRTITLTDTTLNIGSNRITDNDRDCAPVIVRYTKTTD